MAILWRWSFDIIIKPHYNHHYKTVLITITDKEMNARITTSKSELEQLNSDLALLYKDRRATEDQITGLVREYNAALTQQR